MNLRSGVTEADAIAYINEYQARYDLPEIGRGAWKDNIRPRLNTGWRDTGGTTWLFDAVFVQHLAEYIAKRRVLIQLGHWREKRAYSLEDMDNLVNSGTLDGEIDHPVFAPATNAT